MRIFFAAAVCTCTWGSLVALSTPATAAEITDLASSFEKDKPFGFKLGATYNFSFKTASINRESVPLLQDPTTSKNFINHLGLPAGQMPQRTEVAPDLLYTQRRQTMSIDAAIGLYQDLQLGISVPLVLRDERQYDLAPNAGFNQCTAGDWSCVAGSSTTYLDGVYPIQPGDLNSKSGSKIFSPPVRGGSGKDMLDTINISLMGAPVSQRRDPTKPTWVIGLEAQVSVGNIMAYDPTRYRITDPNSALYLNADPTDASGQHGWNGVSEGVHRFILRTALSHRFKYVDPYLGLWYMFPLPRTNDNQFSPWKPDYGFANKHPSPQQKAGVTFGFEATPLENKQKGHRLALDFRAGLQFNFLGRGYSEAWEMLAGSNALICDDQTSLGSGFNFADQNGRPGNTPAGAVTQGYFNPACRTPVPTDPNTPDPASGYNQPRPQDSSKGTIAYYQKPYNGVTLIENYLSFNADVGIIVELFRHARLRLGFQYLHDQGHGITQDDAGTTSYPNNDRVNLNNPLNGSRGCDPSRVDLKCPIDWNPTYRAVINQPGRRYRIDDSTTLSGSAMLMGYW